MRRAAVEITLSASERRELAGLARRRQTLGGRCGGLLTHSYQRLPELLHHARGHNRT